MAAPQIKPFDPSSLRHSPFDHYRKWKWTIQLASLTHFLFFLSAWALYLAPGSNVYAFTEIAGGIVREKGGFIFFLLFSLSFFSLCNLLPSETINAHSTSTSRHSFDVYSGSRPLSFSAACCSLCLSSSLYPPLSLPLPFAHSLRLLYNQIIKRIVDKMILPGN